MKTKDKLLGLDRPITRRDFVGATLVGSVEVGGSIPPSSTKSLFTKVRFNFTTPLQT